MGKDTNKRGQCQIYLNIAEREYLRQSQRYEKRNAEANAGLIMPERNYEASADDRKIPMSEDVSA